MHRSVFIIAIAFLSPLAACDAPVSETVAGASPPNAVWVLEEINDRPVTARTTMRFLPDGSIAGDAPCNSYSATQKIPLPWFEAGPIVSTQRACDDLAEEQRFFRTLDDVIFAEIAGNTMLLTGDAGQSLLFRRAAA
jgi:heat shock protein HslJ